MWIQFGFSNAVNMLIFNKSADDYKSPGVTDNLGKKGVWHEPHAINFRVKCTFIPIWVCKKQIIIARTMNVQSLKLEFRLA